MKLIDAHTGDAVNLGDRVRLPGGGFYQVINVRTGIFSASMTALVTEHGSTKGHFEYDIPLTVRWTHPNFMFQHVAFVRS